MLSASFHWFSFAMRAARSSGSRNGCRPRASNIRPTTPPFSVTTRSLPLPSPTSSPFSARRVAFAVSPGSSGLGAPRRVREHAAAPDQEIQLIQAHQRLPALGLLERVGDGAFLLYSLEPHRERLVLLEGEPQRFPRDGLLDDELLEGLRNRG